MNISIHLNIEFVNVVATFLEIYNTYRYSYGRSFAYRIEGLIEALSSDKVISMVIVMKVTGEKEQVVKKITVN
jgi:hypothetical protein